MKKVGKNIIKGYITSLIGILICYVTYKQINDGVFGFVWEGIAGFGLGVMLILAPDDFVNTVKGMASKFKKEEKENNQE